MLFSMLSSEGLEFWNSDFSQLRVAFGFGFLDPKRHSLVKVSRPFQLQRVVSRGEGGLQTWVEP